MGSVHLNVTIPTPAPNRPIMFTTTWCGYCSRLKSQLKRAGVAFDEVDIEQHEDGAQRVAEANRGNLTVPTMVFSDGTALTNPSASTVSSKIAALV